MDYPKPIKDLIDGYLALPGIGKKTAERLALFTFSEMDEETTKRLGEAIINVKSNLYHCPICHNISETNDSCEICQDETRNKEPIMVVEKIKDVNEAWLEDGHHHDLFIFPGHELYPQELLKEK